MTQEKSVAGEPAKLSFDMRVSEKNISLTKLVNQNKENINNYDWKNLTL